MYNVGTILIMKEGKVNMFCKLHTAFFNRLICVSKFTCFISDENLKSITYHHLTCIASILSHTYLIKTHYIQLSNNAPQKLQVSFPFRAHKDNDDRRGQVTLAAAPNS